MKIIHPLASLFLVGIAITGCSEFFRIKKQDGLNSGLIFVMTLLHFLPRLQSDPIISNNYEFLTGHKPSTLKEFVNRERSDWNAL